MRVRIALQPAQVGAHLGSALVAQIAILLERFVDHAVEFGGKHRIEPRRRHRRTIEDGIEDHRGRAALERQRSGGHLIEHGPEREEVAARIPCSARSGCFPCRGGMMLGGIADASKMESGPRDRGTALDSGRCQRYDSAQRPQTPSDSPAFSVRRRVPAPGVPARGRRIKVVRPKIVRPKIVGPKIVGP